MTIFKKNTSPLEPVVTPPKEDDSIRKVPIVVSLPKRPKFENIEKEIETGTPKDTGRRQGRVKQEIITQECDFCGFIFCGQSLTEIQDHNCLQEEESSGNNTEKSAESSKYSGDHFMANSMEMPSRIVVSPPKKKKKYDVVVKIPNPNACKRPETSKNASIVVKQEPLETILYNSKNTSKNTQVKSKQVIVVSLPKKSKKKHEVAEQNIISNTEIVLPESFGPPVVDDFENVVKQPEKARLKCDFCTHLRSTGSVTTDRSTIRIHMKMEHPNEEISSNHTSNKFTKNNFTTSSSIIERGNVNKESDLALETLVKEEPAETLPEPEASEPIVEDPPTLSEFIESLQTARKFLESRSDVTDREHESLLNLESFAIKEAEKHFS